MSQVTVVAKVVAKPDTVEQVRGELLQLIKPTRQEPGCIEYRLHQDNSDPAVFLFYETWESAAALEQHTKTDHYIHYAGAVANLIVEKVVHKMTNIA